MTSMHQSHHIQTYSTQNLDNNLDALLDDLQTSVSRPGTSMALSTKDNMMLNGGSFGGRHVSLPPGTSGYREITTTVTHETNGIPVTSREYQIEYLNPANSITVAKERSSSPGIDYLQKSSESSRNLSSSYKTESYGYRYEEKSSDGRYSRSQPTTEEIKSYSIENKPFPRDDSKNRNQSYQYSKSEDHRSENTNASKNLNDLENLLRELNDEPQPGMTSTPNVIRREERMSSRTLDTRSPARYEDSSNTIPKRSASANREVTYSEVINQRSDRAQSPYTPGTPKLQQRVIQRESQEYRGHTSRRDGSGGRDRSSEMSPTLRRRTPSPSREFRPSTFSSYPLSPKDTQRTVVTKSHNYSTSSARRTPTPSTQSFDEPQPYRSPSPVSFPQKRSPSPARKSLNRSDSGRNASYQVSSALSDPNSPTVITYKYTSQSSQHSKYPGGTYDDPDPSASRPLPSITPAPVEEQNPPKKLDDLMASFQEPRQMSSYEYSTSSERQNVDLQRSPSSERNVRPSDVRVSQTYSQSQLMQQQQQSPHHSHHHHHHHHHKHHEHHERHHHHQQQMPPQQHYQQQQYQQQYQQQESYAQQQYRQQQQQQQQQESYAQQQYQQYQQFQQQQQQHIPPQSPVNEVIPAPGSPIQGLRSGVSSSAAASNSLAVANSTKSVPGPPVYYPPGVELFTKKEEAMEQYGSKGKMKGKGKMKYKYESKEKSKEKSGSGVTAVPLCLPVCCAAPCVIM